MTRLLSSFLLFLFSGASALANSPTQVYIEGNEVGQGFSVKRLNVCYFIAPEHVIGDSFFLTLKGSDDLRSLGDGQPLQPFGYDLSVGHISGALAEHCGLEFNGLTARQADIDKAKTIVVSTVNSDGLISRTPAVVQETGLVYLSIKPLAGDKTFFKGMSGSLVFSQGKPIGMLQSVDNESGFGNVLRLDRLLETVSPFFSSNVKVPKAKSVTAEMSSDSIEYTISSWSLPPTSNELSVRLIADGNADTYYETMLQSEKSEIDLKFSSYRNIQQLKLTLPANANIKDIEVLTSKKAEGRRGWLSSASKTILPKEKEVTINLRKIKAQRLKLKIYSSWNTTEPVRIAEIGVY